MDSKFDQRRHTRGESDSFNCRHCGRVVLLDSYGTRHRNHCPHCLFSLHVDDHVGDRRSGCGALMEPIAVWAREDGEWSLVHRCRSCGILRANRVAGDDSPWSLLTLAARALTRPPFPVE